MLDAPSLPTVERPSSERLVLAADPAGVDGDTAAHAEVIRP